MFRLLEMHVGIVGRMDRFVCVCVRANTCYMVNEQTNLTICNEPLNGGQHMHKCERLEAEGRQSNEHGRMMSIDLRPLCIVKFAVRSFYHHFMNR